MKSSILWSALTNGCLLIILGHVFESAAADITACPRYNPDVNATMEYLMIGNHSETGQDCMFVYTLGGQVQMAVYPIPRTGSTKPTIGSPICFNLTSDPLDRPKFEGTCVNDTNSDQQHGSFSLTYPVRDNDNVTSFILSFEIKASNTSSYWLVESLKSTIVLKNSDRDGAAESVETVLDSEQMTAGSDFSFSCSDLTLQNKLVDVNTTVDLKIHLYRFQLQPFGSRQVLNIRNQAKTRVFADSFDCSTWFTIPLWMGFFVLFTFTLIVAVGTFLLFEIKTMDRFENPKGKTINVPTAE